MRIKSRFLHKLISTNILCGGIALGALYLIGMCWFRFTVLARFRLKGMIVISVLKRCFVYGKLITR